MKFFSKEKGIVLSILNAVLIIWIISAIVLTISNSTNLLVKDYIYTYDEYKRIYCDFEYDTEESCNNNYFSYTLDNKSYDIEHKRNIIISVSNIVLVAVALFILNKDKKK